MPKKRTNIPDPPGFATRMHLYRLKADRYTRIWVNDEEGLQAFENQYITAEGFCRLTGASRATAYRAMAEHYRQHQHIWWLIDHRNPHNPTQLQCIPRRLLRGFELHPRGNPNFRDGAYQKCIRRRGIPGHLKD